MLRKIHTLISCSPVDDENTVILISNDKEVLINLKQVLEEYQNTDPRHTPMLVYESYNDFKNRIEAWKNNNLFKDIPNENMVTYEIIEAAIWID